MKKIICLAMSLCILFSFSDVYAHAPQTKVRVQGENLKAEVYIINDISFVPLREVCEKLHLNVIWRQSDRSVFVLGQNKCLFIKENSNTGETLGGEFALGGKCLNINGVFYVPARGLGKGLDISVHWEENTRTVVFGEQAADQPDEVYWLSRIISAESQGESFDGMVAVGNVVLNRVKSPLFPDTVYGVIFDRNFGTQFTPVANGTIYNEPTEESVRAAKLCLSGYTVASDCLYFFNPAISTGHLWIINNRRYCKSIGNHDFYY